MKTDDVFVIAEIGGNHEGDLETARKLMHLAIESGADSIKFQVYSGDTLVNIKEDPDRVNHFNNFALSDKDYISLAKECIGLGADFNASIWNVRQINLLDQYMSFYKVGSGDLTAYLLIKEIVKKRKPIVLSTGLSNIDEISETVKYICDLDNKYLERNMISILQCTSMYPIPDKDANLKVISTLQEKFNYSIGYSDHTEGTKAARVAISLGAKIIEVHFTDTRSGKEFRDHKVSFTPDEIKSLKKEAKNINILLGDGFKRPMQSEIKSGHMISFRRALYPAHDIKKGDKLKESDLISLRPMHGIAANNIEKIIGKVAKNDIPALSVLNLSYFK
ncbi:N-acetylneuraminate synthase family protein [Candidatus Pseudothioglobus singularis]|nr:N-acetylneuraminate synthase family protein [Candidatus Pseudothioglobus singularis]